MAWTRKEILEILDRRVHHLVARRYTQAIVSYKDLLPPTFNEMKIGEYIYSLAKRPRDVIAFFNACINVATDQPKISAKQLAIAEGEYSRLRLHALADEWSADYPFIQDFAHILDRRSSSFKLATVSIKDIGDLCLEVVAANRNGRGILFDKAKHMVDGIVEVEVFKMTLFQVFYRIGMIGLKLSAHESESWVDDLGQAVSHNQLTCNTSVVVNPAYIRALGVTDRVHKDK